MPARGCMQLDSTSKITVTSTVISESSLKTDSRAVDSFDQFFLRLGSKKVE
jgi:hypothetical protein